MKILRSTLLLFLFPLLLMGDSGLRDATAAEQAAIDKMQHAIQNVFDVFGEEQTDSWGVMDDASRDHVLVNARPSVPLDINRNFHRTYGTKQDSPRGQQVLSPLQAQAEDAVAKSDMKTWQTIADKLNALMFMAMEAHINRGFITTPPPSRPNDASVAGATLVYKVPDDVCNWNDPARGQCWLIAFGNWERSGYSASNYHQGYDFHFKHPPGTPYIENVVITLRGAPDRIAEVLKLPVWQQVNDALTK